ncbi:hypothetical protein FH608_013625 [Nonomuraea phyllanthi]|uniref:Uncharacterized protein n=1 Tax=Nonomuraea phyllanthi TaxID=2219224 RepID=A0A5C4WNR4_9ACTN|nr:hypothetical protein [Nonomuraea phyllanthi]KAB8195381.1 hypothetical protein FH608_013625 [Nonomuraea phyllanthi]
MPGRAVAGPARTAPCGQDDNRAVHEVTAHVRPGEVVVLTMPEPRPVALLGDLLATQAPVRGAVAVPAADVERTVTAVRERLAKEAGLRARWRAGELSYDVYGMRAEDES